MANGGVSPFGCTEEEKVCCQAMGKGFQPKVKSVLVDLSVLGVFFLYFATWLTLQSPQLAPWRRRKFVVKE